MNKSSLVLSLQKMSYPGVYSPSSYLVHVPNGTRVKNLAILVATVNERRAQGVEQHEKDGAKILQVKDRPVPVMLLLCYCKGGY